MAAYKQVPCTTTLSAVFGDSISELQSLRDEMREWADNLENGNLGHTEKAQAVSEAADTLDQVADEEPDDIRDEFQEAPITFHESRSTRKGRGLGRAVRRDNALAGLTAAIEFLESVMGEEDQKNSEGSERHEAASSLIDWAQNVIDTVEGVDFPGMY